MVTLRCFSYSSYPSFPAHYKRESKGLSHFFRKGISRTQLKNVTNNAQR